MWSSREEGGETREGVMNVVDDDDDGGGGEVMMMMTMMMKMRIITRTTRITTINRLKTVK